MRRGLWLGLLSGLGALLVPKCPLCVVAWLSLFGLSFSLASVLLPALRVLCALVFVAALVAWLAPLLRRSLQRTGWLARPGRV
jgi:hypothetical protein